MSSPGVYKVHTSEFSTPTVKVVLVGLRRLKWRVYLCGYLNRCICFLTQVGGTITLDLEWKKPS